MAAPSAGSGSVLPRAEGITSLSLVPGQTCRDGTSAEVCTLLPCLWTHTHVPFPRRTRFRTQHAWACWAGDVPVSVGEEP